MALIRVDEFYSFIVMLSKATVQLELFLCRVGVVEEASSIVIWLVGVPEIPDVPLKLVLHILLLLISEHARLRIENFLA